MIISAKELSGYLMEINDAQHLAVSLSHRLGYILMLDGDFDKIPFKKVNMLTIKL
jgi:predicted nucleic acid-binding protein